MHCVRDFDFVNHSGEFRDHSTWRVEIFSFGIDVKQTEENVESTSLHHCAGSSTRLVITAIITYSVS